MIFRYAANILAISMAVSKTCTAFAPTPFLSHVGRIDSHMAMTPEQLEAFARSPPLNEIFDGVKFPEGKDPKEIFYPYTTLKVVTFVQPSRPESLTMVTKPKSYDEVLKTLQAAYIETQGVGSKIPDNEDYKFFGTNHHTENLKYLLKTNPFIASALTKKGRGFELIAFDSEDPNNEDNPTMYRKIMGSFDASSHRVNMKFNSDMEITRIRVYDKGSGILIDRISRCKSNEDAEYWASAAIYSLVTYASCVHAIIHVLHYMLTGALDYSSQGFDAMNQWAQAYSTHVPIKYRQVGGTLIVPDDFEDPLAKLESVLTGPLGIGLTGATARPIYQELLNSWVENPSDWFGVLSEISPDEMKKSGVLTEFYKHHDLVPDFAADVAGALRDIDEEKYAQAEKDLKDYIKQCGLESSNINTLEDWIKIMSVSGITHGSTLSYSRVFATPEILRWRNIASNNWDKYDALTAATILGTVSGMDEHRHVMMNGTDKKPLGLTGGPGEDKYAGKLQDVLDEYAEKASVLKQTYQEKIMEDKKEFNEFGWILSDFCTDGFDGKQLTITTYI